MRIISTGSAAPEQILTNDMLASMVDTSDEWIRSRTGIETRHIANTETTLSLARDAAEAALATAEQQHGLSRKQIGIVICATVSNEQRCPSLASSLQRDLGLPNDLLAFDINAACSGFIYALVCAERLVTPGRYALVVGSEVLSRLTDYSDRNTCILFGDGAGAAVLASSNLPFSWVAQSFGNDQHLFIDNYIHMDGQVVFKFAVEKLVSNIRAVLTRARLALEDIDLFICHQANKRIIASAARQLGIPLERFFMNLAQFGNTSAASVPLALDGAVRESRLHSGANLVMAGFGGGLTVGAIYLKWA